MYTSKKEEFWVQEMWATLTLALSHPQLAFSLQRLQGATSCQQGQLAAPAPTAIASLALCLGPLLLPPEVPGKLLGHSGTHPPLDVQGSQPTPGKILASGRGTPTDEHFLPLGHLRWATGPHVLPSTPEGPQVGPSGPQ